MITLQPSTDGTATSIQLSVASSSTTERQGYFLFRMALNPALHRALGRTRNDRGQVGALAVGGLIARNSARARMR